MDLGSNAVAKLEPFLLMSKSAKGAAAAKLVQDATSAPGVFVFAELLELPNIQELASNEQQAPYFSLLQLFAYKTYSDYLQHKDSLPALNQAQITKLKHLSLVTLSTEKRILPYDQLLEFLEMPSIRDLEDLIIDAIYQEVIRGKLDQKEQQFEVEYTMGRDIEPEKIQNLLTALQNWASTTSAVLSTLDTKIESLTQQAVLDKATRESNEKIHQINLQDVVDKQRDGKLRNQNVGGPMLRSGPTAAGKALAEREREREAREAREREAREAQENNMDVDDPMDGPKGKNRKAPIDTSSKTRKRNRF